MIETGPISHDRSRGVILILSMHDEICASKYDRLLGELGGKKGRVDVDEMKNRDRGRHAFEGSGLALH